VIDIQQCVKAQQNQAYARKVKLSNLQQMAQTVAYVQEHGYDTKEQLLDALTNAAGQTGASKQSLKETEQELKDINEQIHYTGQYLANKDIYAEYRKSWNKNKFYTEHRAEITLYETALRILKEKSGNGKLPSIKLLREEKDRLASLRDAKKEDFLNYQEQEQELRTAVANIEQILGQTFVPVLQRRKSQELE
jgi:multidrug efflux pump subunit AcrA (membrane-fusion protein)